MRDHDVRDRTILVTGGAGFVSSHIADALVAENTVRVLNDLLDGSHSNVPPEATSSKATSGTKRRWRTR